METRNIIEYNIYFLLLNPMRANAERGIIVAIAYERQRLIDFYNSELVAPYSDEESSYNWNKTFKKGGPLEWMNPLFDINSIELFGQGIGSMWVQIEQVDNFTGIKLL